MYGMLHLKRVEVREGSTTNEKERTLEEQDKEKNKIIQFLSNFPKAPQTCQGYNIFFFYDLHSTQFASHNREAV
jgi:hypothetical protein